MSWEKRLENVRKIFEKKELAIDDSQALDEVFSDKFLSDSELIELYDFVLNNQSVFGALKNKGENSALRIDKYENDRDKKIKRIPRTLTILRSEDGEFKLIVETKSKLAGGDKRKEDETLPDDSGSFKKGKPAWRVGSREVEYFNLAVNLADGVGTIENAKREVEISQTAGKNASEVINVTELGPLHSNKSKPKINIYAVKANGNIAMFMPTNVAIC